MGDSSVLVHSARCHCGNGALSNVPHVYESEITSLPLMIKLSLVRQAPQPAMPAAPKAGGAGVGTFPPMSADAVQRYQAQFAQLDGDHDGWVQVRFDPTPALFLSDCSRNCTDVPPGADTPPNFCTGRRVFRVHDPVGAGAGAAARDLGAGGGRRRPAVDAAVHHVPLPDGQRKAGPSQARWSSDRS